MKKLVWLVLILFSTLSYSQTITSSGGGTGNWNDANSWSPATVPTAANSTSVIIANTHTITVTAALTIDQVAIQSGGTLVINSGITLTLGTATGDDINVNAGGTLNVNGTIQLVAPLAGNANRLRVFGTVNNNGSFLNSSTTKFIFEASSNYVHVFDGTTANAIPSAAYNATSTVTISGFGVGGATPPTGLGQTFGNFVWNTPNMDQFIDLAGLTTINGDFQVDDTGAGGFYINQVGATPNLTVGGDFNVNGGLFGFIGSTAATGNLTILGDLNLNGGFFQIAEDIDAAVDVTGDVNLSGSTLEFSAISANTDLNIEGDFSFTGGDMTVSGGTGNINFINTTTTQNLVSTLTPTGPINYSVSSLTVLDISGSNFLSGGSNGTMDIAGTIRLGSTVAGGALQNGTTAGNIRIPTASRTYQTGSTIIYNGTGAQFIGNGFPSGGGDVNLTIDNSSGVTLSTNLSIVALRTLNLASGNLSIGTQTLTINGTVTGPGGIVGGPLSNLTIGGTGDFGTLNFAGTNQLLNFTLNRTSSGLVTLGGDLTIIGTLTQTAGDISLNGNDLTVSGNFSRTAGNIIVNSASTLVIDGAGTLPASVGLSGTTLNTLTLDRSAVTLTSSASITVTNLNLLDGTFANGAGFAIANGGTITRNAGSMSVSPSSSGTYNLLYNPSGTISSGVEFSSTTTRIQNVEIQGGGTINLSASRTVNGNLTLTSGDFNIGSNTLTLEGNLIANSSSTFTSGTILFDGVTTISGSAIPTFGNIQVNDTRTLTLPSGDFDVAGNISFEAGAIVNAGSSTLLLSGSSLQTFSGGGVTLTNVTVNKGSGSDVDLTSQLIITGALEVSSASSDFGSNGNLILRSTTDGTTNNGRIGQLLSGASVSGDVLVERFMAAEGRIYRYISAPVSGFTVAQLQLDFPVTGSFTGTSSCSGCSTNQSMFSYNGATQAYVDFPATANTETLSPGVGYSAFVRQDILSGPVTIDWSGPINQGSQVLPVSYNGTSTSWNLVGNPYPSTIDWDNAGWTKTNMSGAISVRDNSTGVFRTWNGSTGDLPGGRIATGQAFWARATAASPSLQTTETVKTSTTGTFFRESEEELNQFILTLSDGVVEDNAFFWISETASNGLDDFDAIKLNNFRNSGSIPLMDLGTFSYGTDTIAMAINSMKQISCSDTVGVYTNDLVAGDYTLKFNASGFVQNLTWILRDKFLNTQVNFSQNPVYQFAVTSDVKSKDVKRFELVIAYSPVEISTYGNTLTSSYESGNQWYLNGDLLTDETGQELNATESGLYTLVVDATGCTTSADIQFLVTGAETPLDDIIQAYPNPFEEFLQIKLPGDFAKNVTLIDHYGRTLVTANLVEEGNQLTGDIDVSALPVGLYFIKALQGTKPVFLKVIKQ